MPGYQIERPVTAFSVSSKFRRPRQRAGLHLKWIRTLPCAICGKRGNIHAAHLRAASPRHGKLSTGIAQKPDDAWTVPLCLAHHVVGEEAQHQDDELGFWTRHGLDPFILSLALWRASGDDEIGFLVISEMLAQRSQNAWSAETSSGYERRSGSLGPLQPSGSDRAKGVSRP